ncbi:MAG: cell wall hydrolase [Clostridiales bacterium]|jgi:N-acetylmuramoyl-L-alanine amidase|nr:cell wall hydrolase [Clostridiales bacterium]
MDTRELFARMINCEAGGEGIEGMKAVATCIMNRVRTTKGEYGRVCQGDLRKVLEQQCQFSCHKTLIGGVENTQNVWNINPEPLHYEIADEAASGTIFSPVGDQCLWYMRPPDATCPQYFPKNGSGYAYNKIRKHCFYNPTAKYNDT